MWSGMPILPMSCIGAARRSSSTDDGAWPRASAIIAADSPMRRMWLPVSLSRKVAAIDRLWIIAS